MNNKKYRDRIEDRLPEYDPEPEPHSEEVTPDFPSIPSDEEIKAAAGAMFDGIIKLRRYQSDLRQAQDTLNKAIADLLSELTEISNTDDGDAMLDNVF